MTRRAFAVFAGAGLAAAAGWGWLRTRPTEGGIPWPLRWMHRLNEGIGRALFSERHLAPEFPEESRAAEPRVNGVIGSPAKVDGAVRVVGPDGAEKRFTPAALLAGLPRVESTTELKCIEGWSQVVTWGGVRFRDAAAHHRWPVDACEYVSMTTADAGYYVGLDTASLMHPQTLLCDRMNGEPLPVDHGGPLRLVIPVKYGIKNIKWLARIAFGTERPDDYWAERGYDWYAGL